MRAQVAGVISGTVDQGGFPAAQELRGWLTVAIGVEADMDEPGP